MTQEWARYCKMFSSVQDWTSNVSICKYSLYKFRGTILFCTENTGQFKHNGVRYLIVSLYYANAKNI